MLYKAFAKICKNQDKHWKKIEAPKIVNYQEKLF